MEVDREVEDTAAEIVADLDHRIRRLEFYLTGALDVEDVPRDEAKLKPDLRARLKNIEESIGGIASERRALNDMLRLCWYQFGSRWLYTYEQRLGISRTLPD